MSKLPFDIDNYHKVFNKYPKCLMESSNRVYGIWIIGNLYKRPHGYYGEYPPSYLKRIKALFPNNKKIIHLFSGTIDDAPEEMTVDINPELNPTIVGDVLNISSHIARNSRDLVIADPPYSKKDAARYGTLPVNKKMVFREARKIVEEDSVMVWLDTMTPIYRKVEWNLLGIIGVHCGTNRVARFASIFQASKDTIYDAHCASEQSQ